MIALPQHDTTKCDKRQQRLRYMLHVCVHVLHMTTASRKQNKRITNNIITYHTMMMRVSIRTCVLWTELKWPVYHTSAILRANLVMPLLRPGRVSSSIRRCSISSALTAVSLRTWPDTSITFSSTEPSARFGSLVTRPLTYNDRPDHWPTRTMMDRVTDLHAQWQTRPLTYMYMYSDRPDHWPNHTMLPEHLH